MQMVENRLDGAIAYRSLIHYDAYGEMSGRQSTSIALLDASRSGLVLSSIHHRDQARLYAKEIHEGSAEHELSPEENEAVRLALGTPAARAPAPRHVRPPAPPVYPAPPSLLARVRVGYFGPEGTFTHEALIVGRGSRRVRARRAADDLRHGHGRP